MFEKNLPIYLQLVDRFKINLVTGAWAAQSYIPSVRELALMHQANPNTVMKALAELEAQGLLNTDRTVGKQVCLEPHQLEALKRELLQQALIRCVDQAERLGVTVDELIVELNILKGTL